MIFAALSYPSVELDMERFFQKSMMCFKDMSTLSHGLISTIRNFNSSLGKVHIIKKVQHKMRYNKEYCFPPDR